jgi:hypothetical protein
LEDTTVTIINSVAEPNSSEYRSIVNEFRAFLSDSKDVLDEATTMKLLERYAISLPRVMLQLIVFFSSCTYRVLFRTTGFVCNKSNANLNTCNVDKHY